MWKKNPRIAIRARGNEYWVKNAENGLMGTLNKEGYFIWKYLDVSSDVSEIAQALAQKYQISVSEAQGDVETMLDIFLQHNLIQQGNPMNTPPHTPIEDEICTYNGPYINKAGLVVTNRCNFSCRHCYLDPSIKDDMTFFDWKEVVHDLKEMGCPEVMVTGGEPFLVPWIWDLLDLLEREQFIFTINTNASLLDTNKIQRLQNYNFLSLLSISIYGLTTDTMHHVTQRAYPPEQIFEACQKIKDSGIRAEYKYTVMRSTLGDLPLLSTIEEKYGISFQAFYKPLYSRIHGDSTPLQENLDEETMERLISKDLLVPLGKLNPLVHCGLERCSVNSDGNASICEISSKQHFGNVRSERLKTIWERQGQTYQSPLLDSTCLKCSVKEYCTRCDGISILEDDVEQNIIKPTPYLCQHAEAMAKITTRLSKGR